MSEEHSAREVGRHLRKCADAIDAGQGRNQLERYQDKAFYVLHIVTSVYTFIVQVFYLLPEGSV
jgi:hypothetical protein